MAEVEAKLPNDSDDPHDVPISPAVHKITELLDGMHIPVGEEEELRRMIQTMKADHEETIRQLIEGHKQELSHYNANLDEYQDVARLFQTSQIIAVPYGDQQTDEARAFKIDVQNKVKRLGQGQRIVEWLDDRVSKIQTANQKNMMVIRSAEKTLRKNATKLVL